MDSLDPKTTPLSSPSPPSREAIQTDRTDEYSAGNESAQTAEMHLRKVVWVRVRSLLIARYLRPSRFPDPPSHHDRLPTEIPRLTVRSTLRGSPVTLGRSSASILSPIGHATFVTWGFSRPYNHAALRPFFRRQILQSYPGGATVRT